jgi:hypothetical protein
MSQGINSLADFRAVVGCVAIDNPSTHSDNLRATHLRHEAKQTN